MFSHTESERGNPLNSPSRLCPMLSTQCCMAIESVASAKVESEIGYDDAQSCGIDACCMYVACVARCTLHAGLLNDDCRSSPLLQFAICNLECRRVPLATFPYFIFVSSFFFCLLFVCCKASVCSTRNYVISVPHYIYICVYVCVFYKCSTRIQFEICL